VIRNYYQWRQISMEPVDDAGEGCSASQSERPELECSVPIVNISKWGAMYEILMNELYSRHSSPQ
jgi:hypothetical protein